MKPDAQASHLKFFENNFSAPRPNDGYTNQSVPAELTGAAFPEAFTSLGPFTLVWIEVYCASNNVLTRNVEPSTGYGQER